MSQPQRFDAVVLGAGPAGEVVVERLAGAGMRTAIVERELIGGECAYWACMPSKTLLRPLEVRHEAALAPGTQSPAVSFEEVAKYRDYMIRDLDDSSQVESYEDQGVRVFKGPASFRSANQVEVGDELLTSERIVVATGSEALIPAIDGLKQAGFWTNREATTFKQVPESAIVLGGGPVGIELAQMLRRFGAEVHLVESSDRLLAREDARVSELILDALRDDGVEVHLSAEVSSVSRSDGERTVVFGERRVSARELIVAIGRRPRIDGLRLEHAGIEAPEEGIQVDERCRAADGVWAVGDVTGTMPFTHVAKYQGRIAVADINGQRTRASYVGVPRVVFCDPEVAAVGLTGAEAEERGVKAVSKRVKLPEEIARPWTYETDPRGELQLTADTRKGVLVGAWAVGPLASEWIHYAALAIRAEVPLTVLKDSVVQFPTYSEAYVKVLEELDS